MNNQKLNNFIDEMIKEWDYDSRRKSNNDIVEKSQLGQRYSNSDSSYDEENETWFKYAGRILKGDKSENSNPKRNITDGSSNSETRELENSSFSFGLDWAINKVIATKVLLSIICFLFLYKILL